MVIDERLPGMSDNELATLRSNAERLLQTGVAKQKNEAERLIPLIHAEQAERRAKAPPPRVRKTATPKTPVKRAAKKTVAAAEEA